MVAPGICHVKARLVDLIASSGIENATSAQPKNLAPRLRSFGGVAGDETTSPALSQATKQHHYLANQSPLSSVITLQHPVLCFADCQQRRSDMRHEMLYLFLPSRAIQKGYAESAFCDACRGLSGCKLQVNYTPHNRKMHTLW